MQKKRKTKRRAVHISDFILEELLAINRRHHDFCQETLWPAIDDLEQSAGRKADAKLGNGVFCRDVGECASLIYELREEDVRLAQVELYREPTG